MTNIIQNVSLNQDVLATFWGSRIPPKTQNKPHPKPQDKPIPKPQDKPIPKPQDKPPPKPQDKPIPKPQDKPIPKPQDKPPPKPQDKPPPKPQDKPPPKPQDKPPPKPQDKPKQNPNKNKNKNKQRVKNLLQRPMLKRAAPKRVTHIDTIAPQFIGLLHNAARQTNSMILQSQEQSFDIDITPPVEYRWESSKSRREHSGALNLNVNNIHELIYNDTVQDNNTDYFLHNNYVRSQKPMMLQDTPNSEDMVSEEIAPSLVENVLVAAKHRPQIPMITNHFASQEVNTKQFTSILFTNVRDEGHLLEWIAHHKNIGFTHIHIFDHSSKIVVKSMVEHIPNVTVERQDIELIEGVKLKDHFMKIAVQYIAKPHKFSWMLYLDADEFLVLPKHENVHDFINSYDNADQIGINWLLFGSNHKDVFETGTLLENFTQCDAGLNHHVKSFVRPTQVIKPINPHAYKIYNPQYSVDVKKRNVNTNVPYYVFWSKTAFPNVTTADAYIAHYMYQDYKTYIERKCNLPRDDTGEMRDVLSKQAVHAKHNTIENRVPLELYNERNKELMEHWDKLKGDRKTY